MEPIIELFKLAIVGIIASFFTSFVTNRDHREKKWWELKVKAYKETIEALSDVFHYFDSYYKAEMVRQNLSDAKMRELYEIWNNGFAKIRKAADSGAFLFSSEVELALRNFVEAMNKDHDTRFEELDDGYAEVRKCLSTIVACSKKDLQLKTSSFSNIAHQLKIALRRK